MRHLSLHMLLCFLTACSEGEPTPANRPPDASAPPPAPAADAAIDAVPPDRETQCDGWDNDGDGQVDEGCPCTVGATQPCFPGTEAQLTPGCRKGTQTCDGSGKFAAWGACMGAVVHCQTVAFNLDDCQYATCPQTTPYPVGCRIMINGPGRGCVAGRPTQPSVFFKEGEVCSQSTISGELYCADTLGAALDANNCPMNRMGDQRLYVSDPSECPH